MPQVLVGSTIYTVPAPSTPRPPMRRGGDRRDGAHRPLRDNFGGSGMPGYVQDFQTIQDGAVARRYSHDCMTGGRSAESCNGRPVHEVNRATGRIQNW